MKLSNAEIPTMNLFCQSWRHRCMSYCMAVLGTVLRILCVSILRTTVVVHVVHVDQIRSFTRQGIHLTGSPFQHYLWISSWTCHQFMLQKKHSMWFVAYGTCSSDAPCKIPPLPPVFQDVCCHSIRQEGPATHICLVLIVRRRYEKNREFAGPNRRHICTVIRDTFKIIRTATQCRYRRPQGLQTMSDVPLVYQYKYCAKCPHVRNHECLASPPASILQLISTSTIVLHLPLNISTHSCIDQVWISINSSQAEVQRIFCVWTGK